MVCNHWILVLVFIMVSGVSISILKGSAGGSYLKIALQLLHKNVCRQYRDISWNSSRTCSSFYLQVLLIWCSMFIEDCEADYKRIWRRQKFQFGNDYLGWVWVMSIQSHTILIKRSHVFREDKAMSQLQDNLYKHG